MGIFSRSSFQWTPEDKEWFYCIFCGKAYRNISTVELGGNQMYTLDFCSLKCRNKYSATNPVKLKDYRYFEEHIESAYWYNRWVKIYNAKKEGKDIGKLITEMDDLQPMTERDEGITDIVVKSVDESTQDAVEEYKQKKKKNRKD